MLVSCSLATTNPYVCDLPSSADHIWKRSVINKAKQVSFLPQTTVKFYLGGISSSSFRGNRLWLELSHPSLTISRKIAALAKALLPDSLWPLYYIFMKYKARFLDCILDALGDLSI
jgi:hypothetical protein